MGVKEKKRNTSRNSTAVSNRIEIFEDILHLCYIFLERNGLDE